jgi:uncharacterized protein
MAVSGPLAPDRLARRACSPRFPGAAILVLALAGPVAATEPEPALEGTAWRLVQIQSMDDGVYEPDERDKYTLTFEPDGRLRVRADCNRGRGTWTSTPPSGLELGPVATTKVLCPPGSLHDRFLGNLGYVRSYVTQDGHLFLATMADGAILEFEPLPATSEPSFDCAKAQGRVEQLVCRDAELAALDVRLDELFRRALTRFPEEEIGELKAFQRGWIKGRNDCWKAEDVRDCVASEYRTRITELQIRSGAVPAPEIVGYACDGGELIDAAFYDNTELRAAVLTRIPDDQVIAFASQAASGARYEGRNVTFWEKGGEARVTWMDRELRCRAR